MRTQIWLTDPTQGGQPAGQVVPAGASARWAGTGRGVVILWEAGDAAASEWFARAVRVAEAVLRDRTLAVGRSFEVWSGPPGRLDWEWPSGRGQGPARRAPRAGDIGAARMDARELSGANEVTLSLGLRASGGREIVLRVAPCDHTTSGPRPAALVVARAARDDLAAALAAALAESGLLWTDGAERSAGRSAGRAGSCHSPGSGAPHPAGSTRRGFHPIDSRVPIGHRGVDTCGGA